MDTEIDSRYNNDSTPLLFMKKLINTKIIFRSFPVSPVQCSIRDKKKCHNKKTVLRKQQ